MAIVLGVYLSRVTTAIRNRFESSWPAHNDWLKDILINQFNGKPKTICDLVTCLSGVDVG